jgi:calcineurin-like phosphoesterase
VDRATSGASLTDECAELFHSVGIHLIIFGNQVLDGHSFEKDLDELEGMSRLANLSIKCSGRSLSIFVRSDTKIGVFAILGRRLMHIHASCPFEAMAKI